MYSAALPPVVFYGFVEVIFCEILARHSLWKTIVEISYLFIENILPGFMVILNFNIDVFGLIEK